MTRSPFALCVVLAACGPSGEPLNLTYVLSAGPTQACEAETCDDIPMTCQSVFSLKIVDPDNPMKVYGQQCSVIRDNAQPNLCALNSVSLDPTIVFPTQRVEVQVAIYASADLDENAAGELICPPRIDFAADGFPKTVHGDDTPPVPALGGRGFTDGYSTELTIELGCTDTAALDNMQCRNENAVDISASVIDFETRVIVDDAVALNLSLAAGEPAIVGTSWVLSAARSWPLLFEEGPPPSWQADDADIELIDRACVQVLEFTQPTASLVCREIDGPVDRIDLTGVRVPPATLSAVLGALGATLFPAEGLVLGIVVDELGAPVADVEVQPSIGTVRYLSADRSSTNMVATSSQGIFISRDAPLNATWSFRDRITDQVITTTSPPVGGLVVGRLTVMIVHAELGSS